MVDIMGILIIKASQRKRYRFYTAPRYEFRCKLREVILQLHKLKEVHFDLNAL